MSTRSRLTHIHPPGRWETSSRGHALALAAALFAGFYVLQARDTHAADALEVLYVVPIALLAVRFGLRGGLAGALVAIGLIVFYDVTSQVFDVGPMGNVCWPLTFLLLGSQLGAYVDRSRRLETRMSRYFEESLDLLVTLDGTGHFTRVNRAWTRLLGYSSEALCARPFMEFVHPEDREATLAEYESASTGVRDTIGFRNRYRTAEGDYRWLEWSAHGTGPDDVTYAFARDVTAQQEAEHRLANHAEILEAAVTERTAELEDARAKTLKRLVLAAEFRDDDTFHHTERVSTTAAEIAERLGLAARQTAVLFEAAPLHDVGKIAIPDRILFKPGRLTAEEFDVMKTHAARGEQLLAGSGSPVLQMGAQIARSHHERWDGGGYPDGLAGEQTPLVARIVAVADVFDALTHERTYKPAWSTAEALAEIAAGAGSQFDPRVVEAFLQCRGYVPGAVQSATEGGHRPPGRQLLGPGRKLRALKR
jgi:PAS domain S-box-containing protein